MRLNDDGARPCSPPPPPSIGAKVVYRLERLRLRRRASARPTSSPTSPRRSRPTAARSWPARPRSRSPTRATSSSAPRGCSGSAARTSSRRCCGSAAEQREVLVVTDQVGCPTYTRHLADGHRAADRGRGVRDPPHRRRRARARGTSSPRRSSTRPGVECRVMSATTEMLAAPGPAARRTRCSAASAATPIVLPRLAARASPTTSPSASARGRLGGSVRTPGHRRRRVHRLGLRAPPPRRRTPATRSGVLDKLTYAGRRENLDGLEPDRVELVEGDIADRDAVARRDRGLRRDRQLRRRVPRRPLDRVARASSSRPTSSAPSCCSRPRARPASATSRSRPTRSTARSSPARSREDLAARALLALLGLEGRRRPDRRRLPPHLRRRRR